MTPIVFWASFPPWPRLNAAAERSWVRRNPRFNRSIFRYRWNAHITATRMVNPRNSPMIGESTLNTAIFLKPSACSDPQPALATAAPAIPPINAWDEDVGSPKYHVITSHAIAPMRPAKTTAMVNTVGWTTPLAIVDATLVLKMRN